MLSGLSVTKKSDFFVQWCYNKKDQMYLVTITVKQSKNGCINCAEKSTFSVKKIRFKYQIFSTKTDCTSFSVEFSVPYHFGNTEDSSEFQAWYSRAQRKKVSCATFSFFAACREVISRFIHCSFKE